MSHTPGPWQLGENGFAVFGPQPDEWGITTLTLYDRVPAGVKNGIPDEEQRANARLIAAAPELLAALEDLLSVHALLTEGDAHRPIVFGQKVIRNATTAIKRAKGE